MLNNRQEVGKMGELLACRYLVGRGYKIIDKNFRTRGGEIDIIAEEEDILVFIEVKTRTNRFFGFPEEAIDFRKQHKLAQTAEYYLAIKNLHDRNFRIDSVAIEIDSERKTAKVRHEKDIVGW